MTSRRRRAAGAVALTLTVALGAPASSDAATSPPAHTPARAVAVELVSQTSTVAQGGTFELQLALAEAPSDSQLELVLHGRVRSRTELDASMEGSGLRGQIYNVVTPVASLPVGPQGTRSVTISLDPATPGSVALTTAGVYPLEIEVQDPAGAALSSLITHVIVRPDVADQSPPLAVAVLARIDRPPARRANGAIRLDDGYLASASALVDALASTSTVPATLAFRPETLEALVHDPAGPDPSDDPDAARASEALTTALRRAAAERSVLPLPYVEVSPDALVTADLVSELDAQLDHGRTVLADLLGVGPSANTWLAGPDLDLAGARELERRGVRHLVVADEQVEPLRAGVVSLSLAQPFVIEAERAPLVDALQLDPGVVDRLGTRAAAGLEVSQVLAELAVLWFEQPGIARAVVLPVDPSVRPAVVEGLLDGLDGGGPFSPVFVDDLFATASPLRQPGGGRVDRTLQPTDARPLGAGVARELRATRPLVASFESMVGAGHPEVAAARSHLLVSTSADIGGTARRAHVRAARAVVDDVVAAITAPTRESITLTAREGSVPLTLQNDTGGPVDVLVQLRSSKAEFPQGATMPIRLTAPTTRLNVPIRARASGTFPLEVTVTAPDGVLTLARIDYSVQSTAVSGVGLVLSVGAAVFLLVWWARHWRTRRSQKLVATTDER